MTRMGLAADWGSLARIYITLGYCELAYVAAKHAAHMARLILEQEVPKWQM